MKLRVLKIQFLILVPCLLSLVSCCLLLVASSTEAAVLYLEPSQNQYHRGDTFIIEARLNTEGESINTSQVNINFSPDYLEIIDISDGNSILSLWPEPPIFSNEEGTLSFIGGVPAGFTGDGKLISIIFRAQETNPAEVNFNEDSRVLLNDGLGTPAKLNTKGAIFTILPEKAEISKDQWQEELKKDKTPPEPFEIIIAREPSIFEGKYFLSFSAIDRETGIDHFEVKEGEREWKKGVSPYLLEDQGLKSNISVKAVDKAGNERIVEYLPPGKPFPWWMIILLGIAGVIIYLIIKRVKGAKRAKGEGGKGARRQEGKKVKGQEGTIHLFALLSFSPIVLFSLLALIALFYPLSASAAGASLYLSPSSGSFLVGSTFSVSIYLNTEGNEINTVWAGLKFPPEIMQVTSPTAGSSFVSEWLTPPNYSNEKGIISFQGGVPGGITASAGLVSSITFRAVSPGTAKIEFAKESKVLLNDGKGTDILSKIVNGVYQIEVPPPEGPKVISLTHPNPDVWYSDSSPVFSWEEEAGEEAGGVNEFSWNFSRNPQERPDGISEGEENIASFSNVWDGVWYFHIRQKKNNIWGATSHAAVRIDTSPPKEFTPRVETYSRMVDYQTMVYFETSDDFSGIDHYEVSIIDLTVSEPARSFFTEELSPYKVPYKKAGKYNVIIKAVDKAGNIRESEARFRLVTPLISHIEGRGLEIKGILFGWWTLGIFGAISILVIGGMIWLFIKRFRNGRNG